MHPLLLFCLFLKQGFLSISVCFSRFKIFFGSRQFQDKVHMVGINPRCTSPCHFRRRHANSVILCSLSMHSQLQYCFVPNITDTQCFCVTKNSDITLCAKYNCDLTDIATARTLAAQEFGTLLLTYSNWLYSNWNFLRFRQFSNNYEWRSHIC